MSYNRTRDNSCGHRSHRDRFCDLVLRNLDRRFCCVWFFDHDRNFFDFLLLLYFTFLLDRGGHGGFLRFCSDDRLLLLRDLVLQLRHGDGHGDVLRFRLQLALQTCELLHGLGEIQHGFLHRFIHCLCLGFGDFRLHRNNLLLQFNDIGGFLFESGLYGTNHVVDVLRNRVLQVVRRRWWCWFDRDLDFLGNFSFFDQTQQILLNHGLLRGV